MLKRFCNKCKQEIPQKDMFYRFTVQQVGHIPYSSEEASNDLGTLDYCQNCFNAMIEEIGGKK